MRRQSWKTVEYFVMVHCTYRDDVDESCAFIFTFFLSMDILDDFSMIDLHWMIHSKTRITLTKFSKFFHRKNLFFSGNKAMYLPFPESNIVVRYGEEYSRWVVKYRRHWKEFVWTWRCGNLSLSRWKR